MIATEYIWIGASVDLKPKDVDTDRIYELEGLPEIKGIANSVNIGKAISTWELKKSKWNPLDIKVLVE